MLKLDNNLLEELGLGTLPEDQKKAMLQHIYETLELRVGTQLANQMTDQQLDEFEQFIDSGGDANQAQALQWLESNLPNYKQVVNDVFETLKLEVKQMAPQITAAAFQQPAAVQSQPQAQDQPQQTMPPQADLAYQAQPPQSSQYTQQAQPVQQQAPQPQQPYYGPPQSGPTPAMPQPQAQAPIQQPPEYPTQQPPVGPGYTQ